MLNIQQITFKHPKKQTKLHDVFRMPFWKRFVVLLSNYEENPSIYIKTPRINDEKLLTVFRTGKSAKQTQNLYLTGHKLHWSHAIQPTYEKTKKKLIPGL